MPRAGTKKKRKTPEEEAAERAKDAERKRLKRSEIQINLLLGWIISV